MGFIERYDKYKNFVPAGTRSNIKYIKISELGIKYLQSNNSINRYFIFSAGINNLTIGFIDIIINIFREMGINNITLQEYMFFISAINFDSSFKLSIEDCINMIKKYRLLSRSQVSAVNEILSDKLDPNNFSGNKTQWRDWHNWKNEAMQVMTLMDQTIYFEFSNEKLHNINKLGDKEDFTKLVRSREQKKMYHSNHKTLKVKGFELHHVVPLGSATSKEHFKILDNWKNMVYIDAYKHSIITQNRNIHVIMNIKNDDLILSSYKNDNILLEKDKNVLYNTLNQKIMLEYNSSLNNI